MEEEVGSHDGCYCPQVHPVSLLPGNHLTEELEEGLKDTQMETCLQICEIKSFFKMWRLNIPVFFSRVETHSLTFN